MAADKEYEAGVYYHALAAVLYAAQRKGVSLGALLRSVQDNIIGQDGIRPNPMMQGDVLAALERTIKDVDPKRA
ncbi:hypothetical protein PO883_31350 [Massilia sp. DJPM01]|uniref:hypothetical protein n=1 Tax=Massilia sp. DJPM01 TaxID=3024404 RepID=UPI00259E0BF5|nr:hypothetical protein [Massilia sp. DJPM01]MDM5181677.1 hypothetical protein [Massilia sp. DJPM01]